jgi:hypothetical protein
MAAALIQLKLKVAHETFLVAPVSDFHRLPEAGFPPALGISNKRM